MTEQAKLTGDRLTDPELNDSIAFSHYTEAIDRISHQYSLWEEAQNEFYDSPTVRLCQRY
jgi:hypothetical protein